MKLYLSSLGLPNLDELTKLIGKQSDLKIVRIKNAWDVYDVERQREWEGYAQGYLTQLKSSAEIVNLNEYFNHPDGLVKKLENTDLIWVHGGNSFYLNYCLIKSNFKLAAEAAMQAGAVYAGDSAGAVITGPTLRGVEVVDKTDVAPEVYYEGLGWTQFGIVPHWDSEKYASVLKNYATEMAHYVNQLVKINDNEFVIVDGINAVVHRDDGTEQNLKAT